MTQMSRDRGSVFAAYFVFDFVYVFGRGRGAGLALGARCRSRLVSLSPLRLAPRPAAPLGLARAASPAVYSAHGTGVAAAPHQANIREA